MEERGVLGFFFLLLLGGKKGGLGIEEEQGKGRMKVQV